MKYTYIGSHPKLQSKTAIGRYVVGRSPNGKYTSRRFMVQVDQRPCTIKGVRWAYGWHESPRKDWRAKL